MNVHEYFVNVQVLNYCQAKWNMFRNYFNFIIAYRPITKQGNLGRSLCIFQEAPEIKRNFLFAMK